MTRSLAPIRRSSGGETAGGSTARDDRSSRNGLSKILLWLGLLAVTYVAVRRVASTDTELSTEEVRERVDEFQERTEEGREQADEVRETAEEVRETAEDTLHRDDHESSGELDDEELPGEDRSLEEIEERAEENVQEKPAQPGEMTVEEDVVADIVDEESATEGDDQESA